MVPSPRQSGLPWGERVRVLSVWVGAAFVLGCSIPTGPDATPSRLLYPDSGLHSLNDRCPVTGTALNPSIEPLYVNGRPIGFC